MSNNEKLEEVSNEVINIIASTSLSLRDALRILTTAVSTLTLMHIEAGNVQDKEGYVREVNTYTSLLVNKNSETIVELLGRANGDS